MRQAEYGARRVDHEREVQAALAEAPQPVQAFIGATKPNLSLMPLGYVREQVQKLEAFRAAVVEAERHRIITLIQGVRGYSMTSQRNANSFYGPSDACYYENHANCAIRACECDCHQCDCGHMSREHDFGTDDCDACSCTKFTALQSGK